MEAKDTITAKCRQSGNYPILLYWYGEAKMAGMKVVVDWICSNMGCTETQNFYQITLLKDVWQAKLKEWGIE